MIESSGSIESASSINVYPEEVFCSLACHQFIVLRLLDYTKLAFQQAEEITN